MRLFRRKTLSEKILTYEDKCTAWVESLKKLDNISNGAWDLWRKDQAKLEELKRKQAIKLNIKVVSINKYRKQGSK